MLAHHYFEAGLTEQAIEWWVKAGERAVQGSAYNEAIAHLEKAIGLADAPPAELPGPAKRLGRLRLQTTYGFALLHGRGTASAETTAAFVRARELAAGVEDASSDRFSIYYGLWTGGMIRAELQVMREAANAFLNDAECSPGSGEAAFAHRLFGTTCWFQGDYVGAQIHLEQARAAN